MKQLKIPQILLALMLLWLIACNEESLKLKRDNFIKEKDKVDKVLNEQKLSNYLRKLMIKVKNKLKKII
jgi:hypothetical protein